MLARSGVVCREDVNREAFARVTVLDEGVGLLAGVVVVCAAGVGRDVGRLGLLSRSDLLGVVRIDEV
ncbi:hypothetical protein [Roseobacter sinensis]|uniref:hypothetical protein n=1 Tax=Roseobacter sinensis TaxID=2931391 RepID=UPI0021E802D6|nr:hypothetical protein [Roseobacter sp. WL0113]